MAYMLCKMYDSGALMRCRVLKTVQERMRGLLGTTKESEPVVLLRCSSIHTWGMRYDIDVAFVSGGGKVLKVVRGLAPGRMVSASDAQYVFERPASDGPWPREGSWLSLAVVDDAVGLTALA